MLTQFAACSEGALRLRPTPIDIIESGVWQASPKKILMSKPLDKLLSKIRPIRGGGGWDRGGVERKKLFLSLSRVSYEVLTKFTDDLSCHTTVIMCCDKPLILQHGSLQNK